MKKTFIIILISVLLLFTLGASYYYFIFPKTPTYTFMQIKKAYETHDVELFKEYVDVDSFCEQFVDDYVAWINQSDLTDTGTDAWSELGSNIAKGMISLMKPQLVSEMKKGLLNSVENYSIESSNSQTYSLEDTITNVLNLQSIFNNNSVSTVKNGKITILKFTTHNDKYNTDLEIDLLLRENGNHLQVVKISNLLDYLKTIDNLEQERIDELNAKIINDMQKILSISKVHYQWDEPDEWSIYVYVTFFADLKNNGNKPIDKCIFTLTLHDSSGNKITDIDFDESRIIKPNSVITVKLNKEFNIYDPNDKKAFELLTKEGITYEVKYTLIHFTDGSELKLHKKFE